MKKKAYKYKFNTTNNKVTHSTRTVAEQLAEINLSEEAVPDVELGENGLVDEEAAFTAYMDAVSGFDATRELQIEEESSQEINADAAWHAYVNALNQEYEETLELSHLQAEEPIQRSYTETHENYAFDPSEGNLTDLTDENK